MKRFLSLIMVAMLILSPFKVSATEDMLRLSGGNNDADDNIRAYEMQNGAREPAGVTKSQAAKDIEQGFLFNYPVVASGATYYKLSPNATNTDAKRVLISWLQGYGASNSVLVYRFKDMAATTLALTGLTETACAFRNLDAESSKVCYMTLKTVTALTADITAETQLIIVGNEISMGQMIEWSQVANDTTTAYYISIAGTGNFNIITTSRPKP